MAPKIQPRMPGKQTLGRDLAFGNILVFFRRLLPGFQRQTNKPGEWESLGTPENTLKTEGKDARIKHIYGKQRTRDTSNLHES